MNPQENEIKVNEIETVEPGTPIDYDEMWRLLDSFPEQSDAAAEREFWFGYGGDNRL